MGCGNGILGRGFDGLRRLSALADLMADVADVADVGPWMR